MNDIYSDFWKMCKPTAFCFENVDDMSTCRGSVRKKACLSMQKPQGKDYLKSAQVLLDTGDCTLYTVQYTDKKVIQNH